MRKLARSLMLLDELKEFPERAPAALLGRQRGVLACGADEAAQSLHIGLRMLGDPARRGVVVTDQLGAPTLGLVQRERILGAAELQVADGQAKRLGVVPPHQ